MLSRGDHVETAGLISTVEHLCVVARAAPKGKGKVLLEEVVVIAYGIPLAAKAKNPFFDRE